MYTMLLSADLMVPDPDATADLLIKKVGVFGHPNWRQGFGNHPYVAHFLRVHKSLAVAPTRVEPQGHLDKPNLGDPFFPVFLKSLEDFQGHHRPQKTHATVIVSDDIGSVVELLQRRKQPFRLAQITAEMPFDRLWVGCTPERPEYEPSVDGGLCVEVMPLQPLQMPPETFACPPPEPRDSQPGDMVRLVSRGYLVRDLDDTLRRLSTNLAWEPAGPTQLVRSEGYRCAKMGFSLAHSASFDVIEATQWDSEAGRYLHNWGPGPLFMRISVTGLDAKAERLREAGVRFAHYPHSDAVDGPLLRVDPAELGGAIVEFVEHR